MVHIDLGVTGAKRQSWRKANPRELLRKIVEQHPRADNNELFDRFREQLSKSGDSMQETVDRYYFDNNIRSLLEKPEQRIKEQEQSKAAREHLSEHIAKRIEEKINEVATRKLLDAIMPNEKPLRDCTGLECKQMGGWLAGIGAALKASQKVSDKFTEEQIQSHWKRKFKE